MAHRLIGFANQNASLGHWRRMPHNAASGFEKFDAARTIAFDELISYESLGLTSDGTADGFILDGDNTYGGRVVTNPPGSWLSNWHPLGATGLAQCAELTRSLRGQAEQRQVEGARSALEHNLGLGGACVVTLFERMDA